MPLTMSTTSPFVMYTTSMPSWVRSLLNDAPAASSTPVPGRKIKAHLYYVSTDGAHLAGVERLEILHDRQVLLEYFHQNRY